MNKTATRTLSVFSFIVVSQCTAAINDAFDVWTGPADTELIIEPHLFSSPGTEAIAGSKYWLVWDQSGNGLPSGEVQQSVFQNIFDGIGDDVRLQWDPLGVGGDSKPPILSVPGEIPSAVVGVSFYEGLRYDNSIYNLSLQDSKVYALLWSDDGTFGLGEHFGFAETTTSLVQFGNDYIWIDSDVVVSTANTIVPEPSTYAAVIGGLCVSGALLRRRWISARAK